MESKVLDMGKIIFFIVYFVGINIIYSQNNNNIVIINNQDCVKLICEKNECFLKFYLEKNLAFNKNQKKQTLIDGTIYCEKCKKESYSVSVKPLKIRITNSKKLSTNEFLYKKNGYAKYFFYKGKYYEYIGRVSD